MDLADLAHRVIRCVRQIEIERARAVLAEAHDRQSKEDFESRSQQVSAATLALVAAKRAKEQVLAELAKLPSSERLDAEHRLMPIVHEVFDREISRLRGEKRTLSRPR